MTASGTFVGPFLGDQLTVASPHGTRVGTLQDNLDGTYSQLMRTAGQTPREFAIGILNQTVPVNGPGVASNRLLWLALFLLLVLLILSLLF